MKRALEQTFSVALLAAVVATLLAAMVMQYGYGEIPCPLCLIQRVALVGIGFGMIRQLHRGHSDRALGLSLLCAIFLLIVAVRQVLLDIYPRPGHAYVGTAVFGLHMPVWSVLIAVAIAAAIALKLCILGGDEAVPAPARSSVTGRLVWSLSVALLAITAVNTVSVVVQCELGQCHTESYALLR